MRGVRLGLRIEFASAKFSRPLLVTIVVVFGLALASDVACGDTLQTCDKRFRGVPTESKVVIIVDVVPADGAKLSEERVRVMVPKPPDSIPLCELAFRDGRFEATLPKRSIVFLEASAHGYAIGTHDLITSKNERIAITLAPLTRVKIALIGCDESLLVALDAAYVRHVKTMQNCEATFDHVAVGEMRIWQATSETEFIGSPHSVTVERGEEAISATVWGTRVHGEVHSEGRPLSNASILLRSQSDLSNDVVGRTDDLGKFELGEIKPGLWKAIVLEKTRTVETQFTLENNGDVYLRMEAKRVLPPE